MRPFFLHVGAMLLGATLSVVGAVYGAQEIEQRSHAVVASALEEQGLGWANVTTDGLQVHLAGTAPDEATRFRALSAAGTVVDGDRVLDEMTVRPAEATPAPRFVLEILRNGDGISLIGLIPEETDRTELRDRIRAIAGSARVVDLLETADHAAPDGWERALSFALDALASLPRSKISAAADRVAVTAITDSRDEKRRVEASLSRGAPAGVALALDIAAPRPVIAPFTLRFVLDENSARFDACSADTVEARAMILQAAAQAGMQDRADCTLGLGAPSPRWGEAVAAAVAAVGRLGGGSVTFSDADVALTAAMGTPASVFDREVGELEAALPKVFSLEATLPKPPASPAPDAPAPPEFTAQRNADGRVELRGRLTDERSKAAVESFAQARFGAAQTHVATRLDPDLPEHWTIRVLAALELTGLPGRGPRLRRPRPDRGHRRQR